MLLLTRIWGNSNAIVTRILWGENADSLTRIFCTLLAYTRLVLDIVSITRLGLSRRSWKGERKLV